MKIYHSILFGNFINKCTLKALLALKEIVFSLNSLQSMLPIVFSNENLTSDIIC